MRERIDRIIRNMSLSRRFMLASLVILLAGMVGIGAWVEQQIVTGVVHRTGVTTALYVDSFVAPRLQGLASSAELPAETAQALSAFVQNTPIGQQIVAFKVWDTRGKLLFTTDASTVGRTYPMHEGMLRARLGAVVSEVSELQDVENAGLAAEYRQLLETYSPVWSMSGDKIIAVAEFYQLTDDLDAEIRSIQVRTRLVVGCAMLIMYVLLALFVRGAGRTISAQQVELGRQVHQLTGLLAQNRDLHARVQGAAARVALLNERTLRRIGSELHDGPAQDLGLALLRLDDAAARLEEGGAGPAAPGVLSQVTAVQESVGSALRELRAIAAGSGLPELADLSLKETIERVVRAHERRSGTVVALELSDLPDQAALPLRITLYRVIQEALNNSFRHAAGKGQRVDVRGEAAELRLEIRDEGPGFDAQESSEGDERLGVTGMRERVESLGGLLEIESRPGRGTRVLARLPLHPERGGRP